MAKRKAAKKPKYGIQKPDTLGKRKLAASKKKADAAKKKVTSAKRKRQQASQDAMFKKYGGMIGRNRR